MKRSKSFVVPADVLIFHPRHDKRKTNWCRDGHLPHGRYVLSYLPPIGPDGIGSVHVNGPRRFSFVVAEKPASKTWKDLEIESVNHMYAAVYELLDRFEDQEDISVEAAVAIASGDCVGVTSLLHEMIDKGHFVVEDLFAALDDIYKGYGECE